MVADAAKDWRYETLEATVPDGTGAGEGRCLREPKVVFSFDLADGCWLEVAMSIVVRHKGVDVSS